MLQFRKGEIMNRPFALVINATTNLGVQVCKDLAESGHDLLIAAQTDDIFEVQRNLEYEGHNVEGMRVSLNTYKGIENLCGVLTDCPPVDILVICSDIYGGEIFLETSLNDEIRQINQNIIAPLHLVKRVLADMRRRHKGKIIFADSDEGKKFSIQGPTQKATRAFLDSFCHEMEMDLKDSGITISTRYQQDDILQRIHDYAFKVLPDILKSIQRD